MHSNFNIVAPDQGLAAALQQKIDQKTKPLGSLGQLEKVAKKIGLIQQRLDPQFNQPQMLVFAGDHGAAKAGVSAFPQDVTWQMVENFLAGGAAINVFARQNDMFLSVIDAGVAHDFGRRSGLINAKVALGTANYIEQPAMNAEQCAEAVARGAEIVRNLASNGCNVVGFGEMGIGNTASASLITHCLTGTSLADCVGRGTGLDDAGLARKQALLEAALTRYRAAGGSDQPAQVLAEFGGFEIAMMVGAMLAGTEAKMLLLIDGFIVGSAALTAAKLVPALLEYCVFCHRSAEPGHVAQLQALDAEPLLDLGLRLGEGTGAALAYPLIVAATSFLNEMASFASAGVAEKELMLRRELEYFFGAVRFFTRLPVPAWVGHSSEALNRSARYFPAVGLLIGGIGALVYLGAAQLWPQAVAVLLSMAATIYATGAFHEDGLSDTVDGLGGGWEKLRILEIMKDSRVGSYGVVAMVLALLGKFLLLSSLEPALIPFALLAGHALSRFCATVLLATMDYVREDLLAKAKPLATRLSPGAMLVALSFVLMALAMLPLEQATFGCVLAALATFWLAAKFKRWLGGYTGDCLGATQQLSEIAFYLGLLASLPQ